MSRWLLSSAALATLIIVTAAAARTSVPSASVQDAETDTMASAQLNPSIDGVARLSDIIVAGQRRTEMLQRSAAAVDDCPADVRPARIRPILGSVI